VRALPPPLALCSLLFLRILIAHLRPASHLSLRPGFVRTVFPRPPEEVLFSSVLAPYFCHLRNRLSQNVDGRGLSLFPILPYAGLFRDTWPLLPIAPTTLFFVFLPLITVNSTSHTTHLDLLGDPPRFTHPKFPPYPVHRLVFLKLGLIVLDLMSSRDPVYLFPPIPFVKYVSLPPRSSVSFLA